MVVYAHPVGGNLEINYSPTWAREIYQGVDMIVGAVGLSISCDSIAYFVRIACQTTTDDILTTLGENNVLNDYAIELLTLDPCAEEQAGQQRIEDLFTVSRWGNTIGGIVIILSILKEAGVILYACSEASMLLRQLQMWLHREKTRSMYNLKESLVPQRKRGARMAEDQSFRNPNQMSLVPTDTSSLIAGNILTACEEFVEGRTGIKPAIFLNIHKVKEAWSRMMAKADIEIFDVGQAGGIILLLVGKIDNWVEALNFMLCSASEVACFDSMETATFIVTNLDKLNHTYRFIDVPEGGFMKILERAKRRIQMRVHNRTRNILLALAWLFFKVAVKNRSNVAAGNTSTPLSWERELNDFNFDVHDIEEAHLPNRLRAGLPIYDKWTQKSHKYITFIDNEPPPPLQAHKKGCFDFVVGNKCKWRDKCWGVHSDQAKCPNGPSCKFISSSKGCAFKGPDSHDP